MLEDQVHQRVGIERRLDERFDKLSMEMASLHMAKLHDRVEALETGVGAARNRTTRELEVLQGNYKDVRMELDVAREAIQSYAAAVEVIQGTLQDFASRADETHEKFVAQLE